MTGGWRGTAWFRAVMAACAAAVCVSVKVVSAQHGSTPPARPAAVRPMPPSGSHGQSNQAPPHRNGAPSLPPQGHLQSWLNEHRNVPVQNQEQLLRGDPSFRRLPPGEQQRLVRQLQDVNHLTAQQQQRRLARAENLERLSPQERMKVNLSAREWNALPQDRQALMKGAFRDLRAVPPEQRGIVLNSQRYQNQFTPQERGILGDMLKVEPYEAPKP